MTNEKLKNALTAFAVELVAGLAAIVAAWLVCPFEIVAALVCVAGVAAYVVAAKIGGVE